MTWSALLALALGADPTPQMVNEVVALEKAGALTTTELRDCEEQFGSITVWRDAQGVVRKLLHRFGSGDSRHTATNFYDAKGRVRFLDVDVGAVPASWVKASFWFDEAGALTKKQRRAGGEGPRWFAATADEYLIRAPLKWLETRGCPDER